MASVPPAVTNDQERSLEDVRRRIALLQASAQQAQANQAPHPPSLSSQHSPPGPQSVWMPQSSPLLQPPSPLASSAPSSPAWPARSAAESPTSSHEGFRFEGYTHTFDYADPQLSPSRANINAALELSGHPREGWQDDASSWNPSYASGLAPPPVYPTPTFNYPTPVSLHSHSYQHSGWPETIEEASNEGSEVGDRSGRPSREGYFDERRSLEEASSSTLREEEELLEDSSELFVTADQPMETGSNPSPLVALADTPSPGSHNGIHPASVPATPGRTTSLPEWPTTLDSGQSHRRSQSNEYTSSSITSSPCRSLAVTDTPSDWATAGTTVRASDDRVPSSDSHGSDNSIPASRVPPLQQASARPDLSRPLTGGTARSGSSESLSPSAVLPSSMFNPPAKSSADAKATSSYAVESPELDEVKSQGSSPKVSTLRAGKDLLTRKLRSPRRSTRKLTRTSSTTEDDWTAQDSPPNDSAVRPQAARSSVDHRYSSSSPPVILPGPIPSPDSTGPSEVAQGSPSPRPSPPTRRKSWHKRIAPHLARKLALRNEVLAGPIPGPLDPSWVQEELEYDEDQLARRRALDEKREGGLPAPARSASPLRHTSQASGASSIEAVLALEERLKQGEESSDQALGSAMPSASAASTGRQPASSLGLEGVARLRAFPSLSDVVSDSPSGTASPRGSLSLRRRPNFNRLQSRELRTNASQDSNAGGSLAAMFTLAPLPTEDRASNDQDTRLSVTPAAPYTRSAKSSTTSTIAEGSEPSKSLAPPKPLTRQRSFSHSHSSVIGRPSLLKQDTLDLDQSQTSFFDAQSNYSEPASLDMDFARSTAMRLSNSLPSRPSGFSDLDEETIVSLLRARAQSATDVTTTSALQPMVAAEAPSASSSWLRNLTAGRVTSRSASGSFDSPIEYQYRPAAKRRPTSVVLGPFDLQVPSLPDEASTTRTQRRQSLPSSFDGKVAALFNGTSSSTSTDSRLSIRRNVAARRHRRRQVQSIDLAIGLGIPVQLSTAAGLGWHETIEESPDLAKLSIKSLDDVGSESPNSATTSDRMLSASITIDTETTDTTLEERRKSAARQRSMDLLMGTRQALSSSMVPFGAAAIAAAGRRSRAGGPESSSYSDSSHQSGSSREGRNGTRSTIFLSPDDFNRHSDRQRQQQQQHGLGSTDDHRRNSLLLAFRLSSASSSLSAGAKIRKRHHIDFLAVAASRQNSPSAPGRQNAAVKKAALGSLLF